MEDRTWERMVDERDQSFAGRFADFVAAPQGHGLNYSVDQLRKILELKHPHEEQGVPEVVNRMAAMRTEVRRLLGESAPPVAAQGRPAADSKGSGTTFAGERGVAYLLGRLKRDDPALADQVVRGDLTANAAARLKGWRKPRLVVSSPKSVAKSLREHLSPDEVRELITLLTDEGP